jgi:hypothetical protein
MFDPSLSWRNDHFHTKLVLTKGTVVLPGGNRGDIARQIFVSEDAVQEGSLEVVGELWVGAPAVQVPRNLECVVPAQRITGPAAAR